MTFEVTRRNVIWSRDHWTGNIWFPVGVQFEYTVYFAQ